MRQTMQMTGGEDMIPEGTRQVDACNFMKVRVKLALMFDFPEGNTQER